jgi:hypothetical protein
MTPQDLAISRPSAQLAIKLVRADISFKIVTNGYYYRFSRLLVTIIACHLTTQGTSDCRGKRDPTRQMIERNGLVR